MASTIVHVEWKGPYTVEEGKKKTDLEDCGIYQVYGNHPIYGKNSLLYIGMTCDGCFSDRICTHEKDWLNDQDIQPVEIYLGYLSQREGDDYKDCDEECIKKCEKFLNYVFWPTYNKMKDADDDQFWELHILNWGPRGTLPAEVSGDRWTYKYGKD